MEFTYQSYLDLLSKLKEEGYSLVRFKDAAKTNRPRVVLRHDVDLSPSKAAGFAEREHCAGFHSTYFVMISSGWYNLFDKKCEEAVRCIQEMGHEVGLHFDVRKYGSPSEEELKKAVFREMDILGMILGERPASISWHVPVESLLGKDLPFLTDAGIVNAYSPEFFNEYQYLSDSKMLWRRKPEQYIDSTQYPKLQILTHPIWYDSTGDLADYHILKLELCAKEVSDIEYLDTIRPYFSSHF